VSAVGWPVAGLQCTGIAGDVVGGLRVAVLDRNLHMVEPGVGQCAEGVFGNGTCRRQERTGIERDLQQAANEVERLTLSEQPFIAGRIQLL
jgi:hypothetical protein